MAPDLVLTDVMMPRKDGMELCRELKSHPATSDITVVLLTALAHREAMLKGWEAKADEYLFKPFHPEELVTRIRSLLSAVAERKAASGAIARYTDELERSNREIESFSYAVSHDLRAPLRAISGFGQMLRAKYHGSLDDEGRRYLDHVVNNAAKMTVQIEDLLKFVRAGKQSLSREDLPMTALAHAIVAEFRDAIAPDAEVIIHDMPTVHADRGLMAHLYQNLIGNAVKYSSKRERPRIELGFTPTDRGDAFYVKDNGAGFDMAYYDKLFGVFQRLHSAKEFEGTGIGLAIVERIAHKHGGFVWAEGKVDGGATFYFSVP